MSQTSTAIAHTNIALIKYWGKTDRVLNLPTTSSLSLTLDKFYTRTQVSFWDQDQLFLNGKLANSGRVSKFLNTLRQDLGYFPPLKVVSDNQVPTAAGLASSASAFAALSGALTRLLGIEIDQETLSRYARRGSGSASRSVYGNFAIWNQGDSDQTSFAEQFLDQDQGLSLIVAEISGLEKTMPSSQGMQLAQTSPAYPEWVVASGRQLAEMKVALKQVDLERVGMIAENNALTMHELNRTARLPFDYFTDQTRELIDYVQSSYRAGTLSFVTLDAGPNVKIITDRRTETDLLEKLEANFPSINFQIAHGGPGITYDKN